MGLGTLLRFDGTRWRRVADAPKDVFFTRLAPRAAGGFWALGKRRDPGGERGVLYAWDGERWLDSGVVTVPSAALWVAHDRDVWLLGEEGALSRWDGQSLRSVTSPIRAGGIALAGTDERDVWLAGVDGLFRWDGQRWSQARSGYISGLLVRAAGDVWAADEASVHHLEGQKWRSWPLAGQQGGRLYDGGDGSVWLLQPDHVLRFTDGEWRRLAANEHRMEALWSAPDGSAWGVGRDAALVHWDGARWTTPAAGESWDQLWTIWGLADDDVWTAGSDGFVAHFDGRAWTRVPFPRTATIRALWGSATNDVWAVGDGVFHWDGQRWSDADVHTWDELTAVWGTGPTDVWASGTDLVLHFDGCWWQVDSTVGSLARIHGGATTAHGEPLVPFVHGLLRRRDGAWRIAEDAPKGRFHALHGSARTGVWALHAPPGGQALLRLGDDERWTPVALPPGAGKLARIHVQGPDVVWVVGEDDAAVYRWDGASWHDEAQHLAPLSPTALWVSPGGDIWLALHHRRGGLLHKPGPGTSAAGREPPPSEQPKPACGPEPTVARLQAELEFVPAAPESPVTAAEARETARLWLETLGSTRPIGLARFTALPITIHGFRGCADSPQQAGDIEGFRDVMDCMFKQSLIGYVPRDELGWARQARSGAPSGTLKVVRPAALARRLERYRGAAESLARAKHVLVQAVMTDHNGMTVHALLAVRATQSTPRVVAVFVDEHFEE